jgi:hypothetical protein
MRALIFIGSSLCLVACGSSAVSDAMGGGGRSAFAGAAGQAGDGAISGTSGIGAGGDASGTGGDASGTGGDASSAECFPCTGYWSCGGDVERVDLTPTPDGCLLSALPGHNILQPDGTISADGTVVGHAEGTGARVHVSYPDGSQWLFCAGGGGCPRTQ